MKLIVLVDVSKHVFEKLMLESGDIQSQFVNSRNCDEATEYDRLIRTIQDFSDSEAELLVIAFSGRESIVRELGDESSEMIVCLSGNRESKYYAGSPEIAFKSLLEKFVKAGAV